MLVGELSRRTGVGAHQLRYYEAQGLLEPDRGTNGYREYPEDAVARVNQIRSLIDSGMSTRDIASVMPCVLGEAPDFVSCPELLALMRAREDRLTGQIEALTSSREALRSHIGKTVTAGPGERPWGRGD
ncbi:MerR family transcriptional regulator [Nocardiopsis sp. NPDC055824]